MRIIFQHEGDVLKLEGNRPLLLSGDEYVYLVENGAVDIFLVPLNEGKPSGSRSHLIRIAKDSIIFGMGATTKNMGLIAVGGPDTRILRMEDHHWHKAATESGNLNSAVQLLEEWVVGLCQGAENRVVPRNFTSLQEGQDTAISPGEHLLTERELRWVSHKEGSSRFLSIEELAPLEKTDFFPLTPSIWLTCVSPGVVWGADSTAFLRRSTFWIDLENFHKFILNYIVFERDKAEIKERNRLDRKATHNTNVMEGALLQLKSVLGLGITDVIAPQAESQLLSCCQMIGSQLDISFKAPDESSRNVHNENSLVGLCRASGVRHRLVVLKDNWWEQENGPILAYDNEDGQPVALLPQSNNKYRLHRSGNQVPEHVDQRVAETLKPEAYMFYRPLPERTLNGREFLSFGLRSCSGDIRMIVLLGFSTAILGLLTPIVTGIIFDSVIPSAAKSQLVQIVFLLLVCAVTTSLFDITRGIAQIRLESKMDISLQSAVWDRLLSLSPTFFRKYSSGDLAFRSMGVNSMRQILSGVTITAILGGIFSLVNFTLLFYYDWKLGVVATGLGTVGVTFTVWASFYKVRYQRRVSELQGKLYGMVLQFITGISKLRVSGTENRAFSSWAEKFAEQKDMDYKSGRIDCVLSTFNGVFPVLASMVIFSWVTFKSMGSLSAGEFLAFNTAYINFQMALLQMGGALTSSLSVVPFYERLKPILEELPETGAGKADPGELVGDIEVNRICFHYDPNGPPILDDVSVRIRPGEFVALVGSSGSGKSTLLRLLLGFESPDSGTVYYDQQDLASLDIRGVRHQIGVVLQNSQLMAGDIYHNIVGATDLTLEDAWRAARMAGIEEDIKKMPMNMHTVIGAGGGTLSGGQRQRLLVARAIARQPRILFFDEATSALDNRTQEVVSQSLDELRVTRVVIAHRLSTIKKAHRIYVLEAGKIVQSGSYEQLMADNEGDFARLAKRQL